MQLYNGVYLHYQSVSADCTESKRENPEPVPQRENPRRLLQVDVPWMPTEGDGSR